MSRIRGMRGSQDAGNEENYDFVTYQGEPLKPSGRPFTYMGAMEETITPVIPPSHEYSQDEDETHGHSLRQLTPG